MPNPWDRREGESPPAYEAFNAYVLMGVGRSAEAVARECKKSASLFRRWSARWDWVERAAAWDRHQAEIAHKARKRATVDQAKKWARRIDQYRTGLYRPFRMAIRFAEKVEREAAMSGQDPPIGLINQSIELVNAAKASAREAILGFPGMADDSTNLPAWDIPDDDARHDPAPDGPPGDPGGRPAQAVDPVGASSPATPR
jgi:hypothetical protein